MEMNKIIAYTVVSTRSIKKVEDLVNEKIEKGWQPIGGMFASYAIYGQALIKYKEGINEQ